MKYSLRSLMIAVLVLPPLLAWAAMPLYQWLTTPKAQESTVIVEPIWVSYAIPPEPDRIPMVILPNSSAPAANPKP